MASTNEDKNHHPASTGSRPLQEPALNTGGGELEEIKPDQVGLPSRTVPSTAGNPVNHLTADNSSLGAQDLMVAVESRSGAATKSLKEIDTALANLRTVVTEDIRVLQDDSQHRDGRLRDIDQRLSFLEYTCKNNSTEITNINDKVEALLHQNRSIMQRLDILEESTGPPAGNRNHQEDPRGAPLRIPPAPPYPEQAEHEAAPRRPQHQQRGDVPRYQDLVTVADSPDEIPGQDDFEFVPRELGPYAPGLHPKKTFVDAFRALVDYRQYRLSNTASRMSDREARDQGGLKRAIDQRYPNIGTFSGTDGMALLAFLHDLVEAFDDKQVSEAAAVQLLGLWLTDRAKSVYDSLIRNGRSTVQSRMRSTWPFVVHALLDKFITDDLLRDERKVVTDARQKDNENVREYARRLEEAADRCRHVFSQTELVHCFVLGLHASTRALVHIQLGDDTDKADFVTVQRLAERCEVSATSLAPATPSVSSKPTASSRRRTTDKPSFLMPTITIPAPSPPTTITSSWPSVETPTPTPTELEVVDTPAKDIQLRDKLPGLPDQRLCDVVDTLGSLFLVPSTKPAEEDEISSALREVMKKLNKGDSTICREHIPPTMLTEEQIVQALSAIPSDYWTLQCWTCREAGHSAFTCPTLTLAQRIFFAYCYCR